jgi:glycerate-2-kinase
VVVRGNGTGGPSQEFALTLALELEGVEGWAAFAADTDGNDGPTDAAGGMVTGGTARAIREGGPNYREALQNNDAYTALSAGGALLLTARRAPTSTTCGCHSSTVREPRSNSKGRIPQLKNGIVKWSILTS